MKSAVSYMTFFLENHWSGALLTSLDDVREWTKTMRWSGIAPNVYFLDREYSRGIKLTKRELKPYLKWFTRAPLIGQWSVLIQPQSVV